MDFFEYASVAAGFTGVFWIQLLVGGLCFAIVFIFEAVALYVIANREGYKNKWMAFIPFFNTYYIGVCSQKNKIFNLDAKTVGLVTAIFEAVLFAGYVLYYISCYMISDYIFEVTTINGFGFVTTSYSISDALPASLNWAAWIYKYFYKYILRIVNLLFVIFEIGLLFGFFQTYACRRYVLFTVTSILFPIQGILFFVVRNNRGVNYREFVKAEQARQYQRYQQYQQQNNFNNPYNQNPYNRNPYDRDPYNNGNNGGYGGSSGNVGDPFDDMGGSSGSNGSSGSGGSPFDEFD